MYLLKYEDWRVPGGGVGDDDEVDRGAKGAGEQRIHHSHETS